MNEKSVPENYKLKQCRPDTLDEAPPGTNQPNYPSDHPQYSYNYEDEATKIRALVMWADGHHPNARWNLMDEQAGQPGAHEHDDYKRDPPSIIQSDPKNSRLNYLAQYRLPDSAPVYTQIAGGDELGPSPEDRAKASQTGDSPEYVRTSKRKEK